MSSFNRQSNVQVFWDLKVCNTQWINTGKSTNHKPIRSVLIISNPTKKSNQKTKYRHIIIISTAGVLYQHHQVAQVAVVNVRGGQKMPMAKLCGLGSRCYQSLDLYFYFYCAARPLHLGVLGTEVALEPPPPLQKDTFLEKGVDLLESFGGVFGAHWIWRRILERMRNDGWCVFILVFFSLG